MIQELVCTVLSIELLMGSFRPVNIFFVDNFPNNFTLSVNQVICINLKGNVDISFAGEKIKVIVSRYVLLLSFDKIVILGRMMFCKCFADCHLLVLLLFGWLD